MTTIIIDIDADCMRKKSEASCRHYVRVATRHRGSDRIVERLMPSGEIKQLLTLTDALHDYPRFVSDHAAVPTKPEKNQSEPIKT